MTNAPTSIFVFGSNLAGRHGAGAARHAQEHHGAVYHQGIGLQGNSYAIPTKDERICTLPLDEIGKHVGDFKRFASANPDMQFQVTAIGCGLAGYNPRQIAPMFADAPDNCQLPPEFLLALRRKSFETPWGAAQKTVNVVGPGIVHYTTASHGGFYLSPERVAEMPEPLRNFKPFAGPNWYEEDCDWSIVALAFPKLFPDDQTAALATLKSYKPELFADVSRLFSVQVSQAKEGRQL